MPRILAVGIATLDIVNRVSAYPPEDAEIRALSQSRRRGGNATNTLVILSQLDHSAFWAGVLPKDADSELVLEDLAIHQVDISAVLRPPSGKLPTSYITLSAATGSRSIVHYRDLPEYGFADFDALELDHFDWIHFEGRNLAQLKMMLEKTRCLGIPCSLEVEKPRPGMEDLFALPDVLLFSRAWVRSRGFASPRAFLKEVHGPGLIFLAWGGKGAWCRSADGNVLHTPAPATEVVDSIGAGDVFNAGVIDALLKGFAPQETLDHAVNLASAKCSREGLIV
ncbi:PfkB family carbohydrate kinase [Thiolapillus brandeum]|uniref:Ketohexokinase n=1 Tax=Thiolapillus brandeum TaxID=1076588 RepID=A0A7U6JH29_9GAMM|nr:PfkB family carbohydrate kinase [Thiolapillus brandeum]BAO43343.1 ketohexokinase [Thiolapillus brandeum]